MASNTNKNLISLAKGKKTPEVKKEVKVEKKISLEEERNLKAKEKVNELLKDVDLSLTKKEDILDVEEEPTRQETQGLEWLQEQVASLSSDNILLKDDLLNAKESYSKLLAENQRLKNGAGIMDDGVLKSQISKVFNELQSNYLAMGKNPMSGEPNFRIAPVAFMNRLLLFFPFLQKEKRY